MDIKFPNFQEASAFASGFVTALNGGQYSDDALQGVSHAIEHRDGGTFINTDDLTAAYMGWAA